MAYIGNQPVPQATQTRDRFVATASQTSFATSGYTPGFLDVYLNGVKLDSTDYTATNGSDVVLASGATSGDIVEVVAFSAFESADHYSKTDSDTRYVNASGDTMTGALSISEDAAAVSTLNRTTSDGVIQVLKKDGTDVGYIGTKAGLLTLGSVSTYSGLMFDDVAMYPWRMSTQAADDATKDLGASGSRFKNLYLSGGVYLGGTGAANYLDDYEEGEWTPLIYGSISGSAAGSTPAGTGGSYIRIGHYVHLLFYFANPTISGTMDGDLRIQLPFTSAGTDRFDNGGGGQLTTTRYFNSGSSSADITMSIGQGWNYAVFRRKFLGSTSETQNLTQAVAGLNGSTLLWGQLSMRVS